MEKLKIKFIAITLIMMLILAIMPMNVFAANENVQIVKTTDDKYIIYLKDMADKEFKFATSDKGDLDKDSIELNYINALKDGEENNVVLLNDTNSKYLYIKEGTNSSTIELDFNDVTPVSVVEETEETTKRIKTDVITINQRDEQVDQVKYEETIGGLEIKDDQDATYSYVSVKLPSENYTELKELIEKLNSEYEGKDMYSKIEFAKQFNETYNNLIKSANDNNTWKKVENMKILQPSDAQKGDQYIVLLKQVKGQEVKYDVAVMTSDRSEVAPEQKEETVVTKRTAKLPITGESLILFSVLGIAAIALIIVFIRMKKLQNKGNH